MAKNRKKEKIGNALPYNLPGPNSLPNFSIACPFCDEQSNVRQVYASYKNLMDNDDLDRVIITPQKIYYPRVCAMGHTFWSVECVPDRYDKLLEEIAEIKEFTKQTVAEYKDSLEESKIGYELTRRAKDKLKRKRAKEERIKRERAEARERTRQRREAERERIRQAKLDGTWVPPERVIWPTVDIVKHPLERGYEIITPEQEAERIRKRDEFLATPGILKDRGTMNRQFNKERGLADKMLAARGLTRKKPVDDSNSSIIECSQNEQQTAESEE